MGNPYFRFKQFNVQQDQCAMKVTTDACLFGAWCAEEMKQVTPLAQKVLDIGAGTGLISLMVAQKNPNASMDAVEIEKEAAAQALQNVIASPWKDRIKVHPADILHFHSEGKYEAIISNPPFYENEVIAKNPKKNVAHHSQLLRLDALFQIIKNQLANNGFFYILLPFKRKNEAEELLKKNNLFPHKIVFVKQSFNHDFFRILLSGSCINPKQTVTSSLSIWNEQQQYTPEFVNLLKDYYLYL